MWWTLLKQTLADWWEDRAPRLGAALAFYTVLSLAPLLVIVTPILATVIGSDETARKGIARQFEQLVGPEGAAAIEVMLKDPDVIANVAGEEAAAEVAASTQASTQASTRPGAVTQPARSQPPAAAAGTARERRASWPSQFAWVLSIVVLAFGATNVFAELQDSLNTIWEVAPKPGAAVLWDFVRQRLLSFAMVMAICFLLLVSLVFSAVLEGLQAYFASTWVEESARLWQVANNVTSFVVVTLLFGLMFKVLPDVNLRWRDVAVGAVLTAALFTMGRHLIGAYLGRVGVGERYGASRSLVALLVWVYYSAQILLLGAEFTKVWSRRHGVKVVPTSVAVPVTEEARAQAGIPHKEVVEAVTKVVDRKEAAGEYEAGKTISIGDKSKPDASGKDPDQP